MEDIKLEDLHHFLHVAVKVGIQDMEGNERAPLVEKTIKKLEICPDHTHLRIYFNESQFFAVPLNADVTQTTNEWTACDIRSGLNYTIRKGNSCYE